jgi:hypothetical protein
LEGRKTQIISAAVILIAIIMLVVMTLVNYRYTVQNPGGTDFMIRWLATRKLVMEGMNPYSEDASRAIQEMFYGQPARSDQDQLLFVYPMYSTFIFGPYSLIPDYHVARAVWMTTLEVAILLIAAAGISLSRWTLKPAWLGILLAFSLLFYYGLRSVINGNIAVLVGLMVAGAFLAIRAERDEVGFAAMSTVKPPVIVLLLPSCCWAISRRRWMLF